MKIYVVTEGDYSAYHIEAVFTVYKKAKEYCEFKKIIDGDYSNYRIETYEDTEIINRTVGIIGWFKKDNLKEITISTFGDEKEFVEDLSNRHGIDFDVRIRVNAEMRKDETKEQFTERAKKIAIDKYFQWKSEAKQCE